MLQPVVIMSEGAAGVVRRIDEDAFHLARVVRLQGLEREQVVAVDQNIVENVVFAYPCNGMVALFRILDQDAWLQPRPIFLPHPSQLEFLLFRHVTSLICGALEARYLNRST